MRTILLNPGPVTLSARVRAALTGPDLCHREVEFLDLQDRLRRKLREVYARDDTTWGAVLLTGSGTAAVEAMVASCVPRDGRLLVVENGVYGERMRRIAAAHGIDCASVQAAWGEAIDLAGVRAALGTGGYSHVAVVHHETTTGRLNDLAPLADACREHGARLLLDTVSSFGAEAIDFDAWPIDACAATANKCLHGVPGTAFVIARRAALAALEQPRTVYLDLAEYLARQDGRGTPFTQSVQTFYALDAALDEFFEAGGWRAPGPVPPAHGGDPRAPGTTRRAPVAACRREFLRTGGLRVAGGTYLRRAARRAQGARLRHLRRPGRAVRARVPHLGDG